VSGPEPEWPHLRITDQPIDAPDEAGPEARLVDIPATGGSVETVLARPHRKWSLRWGVLASALATLGLVASVGFAVHRTRTITTTTLRPPAPAGVDAAGCPRGDNCSPTLGFYTLLLDTLTKPLPGASGVLAADTYDASQQATLRSVRLFRLPHGVVVTAISQCRPDATAMPSWSQNLSGRGPALVVLVRPGRPVGCATAVLAQVPAGVPVPVAELTALATRPDFRP